MSLDRIREVILHEAATEAQHIVDAARKAAAASAEASKAEAAREYDRLLSKRSLAMEEELNRRLVTVHGEARKQILERRGALLDAVFEKAREEILAWPEEESRGFWTRMIEQSSGRARGRVRVHRDDAAFFAGVIDAVNRGRAAAERIDLAGENLSDRRGGFVFMTDTYEVDRTLDTLIADVRHEMLPVIAHDLFAGQEKV